MLDAIIRNGLVVDGSGKAPYSADVAIQDGRIVEVSPSVSGSSAMEINATGMIVSPGFIDNHSHSDLCFLFGTDGYNLLEQGITTEIAGQCGFSPVPTSERILREYSGRAGRNVLTRAMSTCRDFETFTETVGGMRLPLNMAFFAGHGVIRESVMGFADRPPDREELESMKGLLRHAMEVGFLGMSTGLVYPPSSYAAEEELVELAKVIATYDGLYSSHIRGECRSVKEATAEAIRIGRRAGCRVHISHMKIGGICNEGISRETLALVERARRDGMSVTADQYPYLAAATSLLSRIPGRFLTGGIESFLNRLRDPGTRRQVTEAMTDPSNENGPVETGGYGGWLVLDAKRNPSLSGKTIADIATERRCEPQDAVYDLLIENDGLVDMAYFYLREYDMDMIMEKPFVMVGCDAMHAPECKQEPAERVVHPRFFGTFPRFIRLMRERNVPLESIIERITSFPARTAGLEGKGTLKSGYDADLVVFNPATISDGATFTDPRGRNSGIEWVFVNGVPAVKGGEVERVMAGRMVLRARATPATERHHAFISGDFFRRLDERRPESAKVIFGAAVRRYGQERGERMALRALRDGRTLDFRTYLEYGEWDYTEVAQRAAAGKETCIVSSSPDFVYEIFECPWNRQWLQEMGLAAAAEIYCSQIDKAIAWGFNPALELTTVSTMNRSDRCRFELKGASIDAASPLSKASGSAMPFEYHCAHLLRAFIGVCSSILGPEGIAVTAQVIEDFEGKYGWIMARRLAQYIEVDFSALPVFRQADVTASQA